MRECELFLGNLSVCEQLSGRERAGKLECSKTGKSSCVFKDVRVLLLKEPISRPIAPCDCKVKTSCNRTQHLSEVKYTHGLLESSLWVTA